MERGRGESYTDYRGNTKSFLEVMGGRYSWKEEMTSSDGRRSVADVPGVHLHV